MSITGGSLSRRSFVSGLLAAKGNAVAIDFSLGEVVKMVGSKARKRFVKGHLTGWSHNPLTMGADAAARPGRYGARADPARSLKNRLYFAGEATAAPYYQLCSGAYSSGEVVAAEVGATIN